MKNNCLHVFAKGIFANLALFSSILYYPAGVKAQTVVASSCTPSFTHTCSGSIAVATTSNHFMLTGTTGSINDGGACSGGYTDNSGSMSCTLNAGTTYTAQVGGSSSNPLSVQVWIDFNSDGIFESSESVGGIAGDWETGPANASITIPAAGSGISAGTYRMRVIVSQYTHGSSWGSPDDMYYPLIPSCPTSTTVDYGECRDYAVTIATPAVYTLNPTSITFPPTVVSAMSPSVAVTFSAAYLTPVSGSLTVSAPTGFQVYNGSSWGASASLSYTSGTLAATAIPVRFAPSTLGLATGNVAITGGGLATVDVALTGIATTACSGTPTTGHIGVSPSFGNANTVFSLIDTTAASLGGGTSFQWMSCTSRSGAYTNVAGAITPVFPTSGISASKWYVCVETCGTSSSTSDTAEASFFAASSCTPYTLEDETDCASGSCTNVVACASSPMSVTGTSGTLTDAMPCNGTGYMDETADAAMTCTFEAAGSYTFTMGTSFNTAQVWIDFNNNGIFETSESVGGTLHGTTVSITLPATTAFTTGAYRMRVEVSEGGSSESADSALYPDLAPCMWSYSNKHGEARDYRITANSTTVTTTAIQQVNSALPIVQVYPNPTYNTVNIACAAAINVVLTGIDGQLILTKENANTLDLSGLSDGVYILSVYDAENGMKLKTEKMTKIGK